MAACGQSLAQSDPRRPPVSLAQGECTQLQQCRASLGTSQTHRRTRDAQMQRLRIPQHPRWAMSNIASQEQNVLILFAL